MICLTRFDYLYSHISCSRQNLTKNIEDWCPDEYYFPPNSVVYSFVFFLYSKFNPIHRIDFPGSDIDLCSLKINNRFQCLTNPNECIHEVFVGDAQYDCLDRSDEYFFSQKVYGTDGDGFRSWSKRTLPEIYPFNELCNSVINRHFFSSVNSSETDETNCEHWPYSCYSVYTKCNRIWNCANGRDEIPCENKHYISAIRKALRCNSTEYYCIRLISM